MDFYKRKWPTHPLASRNQKYLCIQAINSIQGTKPAGKLWYDLLKSIFITVKMIISSSDHAMFSWVYNNNKPIIYVEIDDILMETENKI